MSALAEAEVEYEDRKSTTIDVAFPLIDREKLSAAFGGYPLGNRDVFTAIWTTTPWTIPSNQALNAHPAFTYALVDTPKGLFVLAQDLVEANLKRYGLEGKVVATAPGKALELIRFKHPLYDRPSPVYLGEYVTLDAGTGIVHSSPAYGVDDFVSCKRYGMTNDEILNPVGDDGKFAASLPLFGGMHIWDANPKIVEALQERGALLHTGTLLHSYPHCWRHHTPIIYRATTQWFVGMDLPAKDGRTLRDVARQAIADTQF
jgi:isoleucyl-tRNA synthetase